MNIVVKLDQPSAGSDLSGRRFDLEAVLKKQQQDRVAAAAAATTKTTTTTTPSDDHFLFFKEALGPIRCSSVDVRFDGLLQKERVLDEWELSRCRHCDSFVFARHVLDDGNADGTVSAMITCLINPSLMTNVEQLNARMTDGNYSHAFGIVLNGSSLSYSDLTGKGKLLSKVSDNQFVQRFRAYMEQETEAANERIQRFTEQEFAVLKVKRERAEQDCLILAKLAAAAANNQQVPDELLLVRSNSTSINSSNSNTSGGLMGSQQTVVPPTVTPPTTTAPSNTTNVNDTSVNSQLETPPPTPEYMPMSTGNSPPMTGTANSAGNTRSSSSMVDQSSYSSPNATRFNGQTPNRANLSYNNVDNHPYHSSSSNNNNNNIVSFNNSRGAMSRQQQQPVAISMQQHSSTNSMTAQQPQQQQQQYRMTSYETDCMFDIDGMENDNSPLSNALSDEEELGFDESISNNNEDGMYIPSRQLAGKNGSIARSLPISMPQLMTQFRTNEEDFEEMNEDNVDIAASIKALARSVHGDTVFGDLPRPQIQRFSTQI